jgi:large subunit ribosomal protein L1
VTKLTATSWYVFDALGLVKEFAVAKFDESIDVGAVQLGIDKKTDQVVRGAVVMLHRHRQASGRVAVFAQVPRLKKPKPQVLILSYGRSGRRYQGWQDDSDVAIAS